MTDQTEPTPEAETPIPVEEPPAVPAPAEDPAGVQKHTPDPADGEADDDDAQTSKLRKEAAGYRTKLREAEGARDAAIGRLEAFQRQALSAASAGPGRLADGADLWRDGSVALDHLVGEDGALNTIALDQAVARLIETHPHWRHQHQAATRRPAEALRAGASSADSEPASWAQVLRR